MDFLARTYRNDLSTCKPREHFRQTKKLGEGVGRTAAQNAAEN